MRSLQIVLVLLALTTTGATPAPTPAMASPGRMAGLGGVFVPTRDGSDFTATYKGWGPPGEDSQIVRRKGHWLRVDRIEAGRPSTHYGNLSEGAWISLTRTPDGDVLDIRKLGGAHDLPGMDYDSRRLGQSETGLGEACEVWLVYQNVERSGFRQLGCVTIDGIELWRRTEGSRGNVLGSAFATGLNRTALTAQEVEPPANLLDLQRWFPAEAGGGDFEVVLAPDHLPDRPTMMVRRRGNWTYEERSLPWRGLAGGLRMYDARRSDGRASAHVAFEPGGPRLVLQRRTTPLHRAPLPLPPLSRAPETVLGERCAWFDLMPNVADAGRKECRTADGAPLRIVFESRGDNFTYTAVKISRRPLPFAAILPPRELLRSRDWGLEH